MRTERADVNQLLQQMRQMQSQVSEQRGLSHSSPLQGLDAAKTQLGTSAIERPQGFGDMFRGAIDSVNATQKQASSLATSFEQGDPQVSLAQVMVASQKASVSFQALTQVRNRLVDAYKDIMNMPV